MWWLWEGWSERSVFHSPKISGIWECIIRYRHISNPLLYYYDGQAISNLKNESFGYIKMFLLFNLLHHVKIAFMTSKLVYVQTYLNTLLAVLAVKLHNTELRNWTYMRLKNIRNNTHAIYVNTKITRLYITLQSLNAETFTQSQKRINL